MRTSTYLFESLDVLREGLSFVTEKEQRLMEVSWNSERLALPLNSAVIFSRVEPLEGSEGSEDAKPRASKLPEAEQRGVLRIERLGRPYELHHNVKFSDCPALIAERFDVDVHELKPRVFWTQRVMIWRVILPHRDSAGASGAEREARLSLHAEATYYDASTTLRLAREQEVRVQALEGMNQRALHKTLMSKVSLPSVSPYWMAEYHYKRLMRLPTYQDLTGYEYEAKLSVEHLEIDELPPELDAGFQLIERYQTESVRWYVKNVKLSGIGLVKKGRVGFRGARASLVSKGKKDKLEGGILKRREEKSQGLNTWELSRASTDCKEMRRIKRQLYVLARESKRVYALCLDYCYVEGSTRPPLLQVELEYNGRLLIDPLEWSLTLEGQLELAERFIDSAPKVALRCLERAGWIAEQRAESEATLARYDSLKERFGAELATEREPELEQSQPVSPLSDEQEREIEREVLAEMRSLLSVLRRSYGYKATSKTKREWLKAALKTMDQEPLL